MRLRFLGTRGNIARRSRRHRMHSALMVLSGQSRILIDCGEDWLGRVGELAPTAIVLTHAHPDHAFGLRDGAGCPVYATGESWAILRGFPIAERRRFPVNRGFRVDGIRFRAWRIEHSVRAPAVGFRISDPGRGTVFYAPDIAHLPEAEIALRGVSLYIGDGATITRPMIWRAGDRLIGHAPIRRQLEWCRRAGVSRAAFTHCGMQIVGGDSRSVSARVRALGRAAGVEATIARDGDELAVGAVRASPTPNP